MSKERMFELVGVRRCAGPLASSVRRRTLWRRTTTGDPLWFPRGAGDLYWFPRGCPWGLEVQEV